MKKERVYCENCAHLDVQTSTTQSYYGTEIVTTKSVCQCRDNTVYTHSALKPSSHQPTIRLVNGSNDCKYFMRTTEAVKGRRVK